MNGKVFVRGAAALLFTVAGCSLASEPGTMTAMDMAMAHHPPPVTGDMAMHQTTTGGDMAMPVMHGSLPFVVDTQFVSSGYMGDGATAGTIAMVPAKMGDSTDCNGQRAATTAAGSCHSITYTPPAAGTQGWGGVYWQYPANNWGMKAGFAIPTGAKQVSFQAKGSKGGEKVTFLAGGIIGASMPHTDSLKASTTVTLTNAWATYSIDISTQTYTEVLGAFGWTMVATDAGTSGAFFVDDIQWK
jgi:hypothetical protein